MITRAEHEQAVAYTAEQFAAAGIELISAPNRRGKTAAENAAVAVARGDIIVNVDATVVVPAASFKRLIRVFDDPTVGVASGRDVSVGAADKRDTGAESGYTRYEMWVRDLETRAGSIVGASGCFYGIRRRIRTDLRSHHNQGSPDSAVWNLEVGIRDQLTAENAEIVEEDILCVLGDLRG